jgi:hypothetical protein
MNQLIPLQQGSRMAPLFWRSGMAQQADGSARFFKAINRSSIANRERFWSFRQNLLSF